MCSLTRAVCGARLQVHGAGAGSAGEGEGAVGQGERKFSPFPLPDLAHLAAFRPQPDLPAHAHTALVRPPAVALLLLSLPPPSSFSVRVCRCV